jgi:hypothetical protein
MRYLSAMRDNARRRFQRRLGLIGLVAVVAVAVSGCGSSTTAAWPTAGQARATLTTKYHYTFVPYQERWRAANSSLQLQISVPQDDSATDNMMIGVYYGKWTTYSQDIDNVFDVIAPDAKSWAHEEEAKLATNSQLQDTYNAANGTVTCVWNEATPALLFVFTGS